MPLLFSPFKLGHLEIKNRFVHSATYECLATDKGEVTEALINRYKHLAQGQVGLIIPGYMFVHPLGQALVKQTGIYSDDLVPGLTALVEAVHREGGKVVFQLAHAGRQTSKAVIGRVPMGPSNAVRDPQLFFKPKEMTEEEIDEVITAFVKAAERAIQAGADGIQLHGAHGYLINQFLSPFINRRTDMWGGSDEKRFRFLREVFQKTKSLLPDGMPLLIKLNTHDHTPKDGIIPSLAAKYAEWLAEMGIDGLEVSCGSGLFSPMNMCRGDVPLNEFVQSLPGWQKPLGKMVMKKWVGKYDLFEGYNLDAARAVKSVIGDVPLILVGGMRTRNKMEEVLQNGEAELISMSRPFIREPFLVKRFMDGKADAASCVSCNKCLAAIVNKLPIRCYYQGFPAS